jgi:hypothetical protein
VTICVRSQKGSDGRGLRTQGGNDETLHPFELASKRTSELHALHSEALKAFNRCARGTQERRDALASLTNLEAEIRARPERFELPTNRFEAGYSIQLSYGRIVR